MHLCIAPFPRPWRNEKSSFDILMCAFFPRSLHPLHRYSKSSRCISAIMQHGDLLWESCFIFKWLNTLEGKYLPTPPTHSSLLLLPWGFCSLFCKNVSVFAHLSWGFFSVAAFKIWAVSHGAEPRGQLWEQIWGRQKFNFKWLEWSIKAVAWSLCTHHCFHGYLLCHYQTTPAPEKRLALSPIALL